MFKVELTEVSCTFEKNVLDSGSLYYAKIYFDDEKILKTNSNRPEDVYLDLKKFSSAFQ